MTVLLLAVVAVSLLSIMLWREARWQRRDTAIAATVAKQTEHAEIVLVLCGGPCDGGRIRVSPSVARLMRADNPLMMTSGKYLLESVVVMPDGGVIWTYQWQQMEQAA